MTQADQADEPERTERKERPSLKQDPWGVKRVENLITSLQGVLSARVVVSPIGEVTEVHVLTQGGLAPKQVVRNVESALLAHLGLKVDHRKISVAQTAEVQPIEVLEGAAIKEQALKRGVIFKHIDIMPGRPNRVKIGVTLQVMDEEISAEEESADTPKARVQGAARAAVSVLDRILPRGTVELDGSKILDAFDTQLAFVAVYILDGRETRLVTGTCEIKESPEQAAALAVLDATNRWVQSQL